MCGYKVEKVICIGMFVLKFYWNMVLFNLCRMDIGIVFDVDNLGVCFM